MKISFVEPHLKQYGGIRRIIELANRLYEKGHDVTIFHSDGSDCTWMKCKMRIRKYEEVLNGEHDVVLFNDPPDYPIVNRAKAKLKVYYVLALYNKCLLIGIHPSIYLQRNRRVLLTRKSLKSPYLKLSNATWMYQWLKKNLGIESKLLIGGVNIDTFRPVEVKKNSNEIRIICSGDLRKRKGTKTVFEAIKIIKEKDPRIILDTYHGKQIPQDKMAEKYCSADIFVDGQWYAGWNNPVAEAMACGVPVVCTDIGGVKDFAFHEETALLVPTKDPKAMASAILRLIKDKNLRESLRENAYQHIKQFDWDKSAERLEKIIIDGLKEVSLHKSYIGHRNDILRLVPQRTEKVLDIGCSIGTLGQDIKAKTNAEVIGIELDTDMAEIAKQKIDQVIIGNIENIKLNDYFVHSYFDCIIFADILEHLINPDIVLHRTVPLLSDKGVVIISIPNVRHYSTIFSLVVKGSWPYRERGIHDKNHLRFFTLRNIREIIFNSGLEITTIRRNYRIIEESHKINKFSKYFAFPFVKEFITFQYLIVARKRK